MISSLEQLSELNVESTDDVKNEIEFLLDSLEVLRATNEISNDAFLEAGSIQGGLNVILNMLNQGIEEEANSHLFRLKERAKALRSIYPDLDSKIERRR